MVLDAPSNQAVPQGTSAAELQAQQHDEQPVGLETRIVALDSVRRPNPSIQSPMLDNKGGDSTRYIEPRLSMISLSLIKIFTNHP